MAPLYCHGYGVQPMGVPPALWPCGGQGGQLVLRPGHHGLQWGPGKLVVVHCVPYLAIGHPKQQLGSCHCAPVGQSRQPKLCQKLQLQAKNAIIQGLGNLRNLVIIGGLLQNLPVRPKCWLALTALAAHCQHGQAAPAGARACPGATKNTPFSVSLTCHTVAGGAAA